MTAQTTAALSLLSIDGKSNVRKQGRGISEPAFVGSIAEKGIIEPLVVRKNGGKGFLVVNGGKRCAALAYMGEKGIMAAGVPVTPDYQVPIIVREENDADARDTSLITNIVRSDMHPVDEYEAFAAQVAAGRKPADLAATYGIDVKRVEQALALGSKLSPAVRDAWREDLIDAEIAQALTLAPDKTSQERVLAKAIKNDRYDGDDVIKEFKIKSDVGLMLDFVGIEAYEKRGGKVELDLFGSNHRASDDKLVKAMHGEKLDALAEQLVKDGWAWAKVLKPNDYPHDHGHLPKKKTATPDERAQLRQLEEEANDFRLSDAEQNAAQVAHDKLQSEITARSYTPEMRAKAGVFLKWGYHGLEIDYGRTKPEERKKVEAQQRVAKREKKVKTAKKEGAVGVLSNALHQRLSEQLTAAVAKALSGDPKLALPAILAGFAAGSLGRESPVKVEVSGAGNSVRKHAKFAAALAEYSKMGLPAQLQALATVAAASIDMEEQHIDYKPLKNESYVALIAAMNPKAMNDAARGAFDAKDFFDSASKDMCLAVIAEAINADEARKLAGKPKVDVAKFAVANVPKTKWLPAELRTVHYDGPVAKKAAPASRAKRK